MLGVQAGLLVVEFWGIATPVTLERDPTIRRVYAGA
jgi:hypothetical protein